MDIGAGDGCGCDGRKATLGRSIKLMKIGFFSIFPLTYGGGAEGYLINVARFLALKEHNVTIFTLDQRSQGILSLLLSAFYMRRMRLEQRETMESVERRLAPARWERTGLSELRVKLSDQDILYAKNEVLDLMLLSGLGNRDLPPLIAGVHTPIHYPLLASLQARLHNILYLSPLYRKLLDKCAAVHVLNSYEKRLLQERLKVSCQIFRIPIPIDTEMFQRSGKKGDNQTLDILFTGRLTEQKGIDILTRIVRLLSLRPEFSIMRFIIAGSGELERIVLSLEAEFHNVKWLGQVPHEQMPDLYASCDILIVPSRWESLPYSCLEAQSAGLIIVASDIPGLQDIVQDNDTGFLIPEGNRDAFVERILWLWRLKRDKPQQFAALRKRAQVCAEQNFNSSAIYSALESMFASVAARKGVRNH